MNKTYYYINGNTVRELEAQPVRRERQTQRDIEIEQKRRARQKAARRNKEKALIMSRSYVAMLMVCVMATAFAALTMVHMQSQLSQRMRHIANLESQTQSLKAENDARYKEITTSIDLNHIKDVAINELGMSYASEDQIVYYTVEHNNFMDQFRDIPQ